MGVSYELVERVKDHLGSSASPLCQAMVRILVAKEGKTWTNTKLYGVLALVIDRTRGGCKLLRVYDEASLHVFFDQELYIGMQYASPLAYFHTFEVEGAVIGLDFCDEQEAMVLYHKLQAAIPTTTKEVDDYGARSSYTSKPRNVQHLQHIGYDPDKGFEVSNIPEEWKALFKSAGVTSKDLKDKETAQMLINTIQDYADTTGQTIEETAKPAPPSRLLPPKKPVSGPPSGRAPPSRPPLPSRPSVPSRSSVPSVPSRPSPPSRPSVPSQAASKPASKPAPPPSAPKPQPRPAPSPKPSSGPPIGRAGLLDSIRGGAQLRKVTPKSPEERKQEAGGQNELVDKIKLMMQARRKDIDDHESDDDDDW